VKNNSVISYRARLARNIRGYAFPGRMDARQRLALSDSVAKTLTEAAAGSVFTYIPPERLTGGTAIALKEQRLISPGFAAGSAPRGLVLSADGAVSVMLCEEDHLRIQVFGEDPDECLRTARNVEKLIGGAHPYVSDKELGYLTACPTNLGIGLRVSALMHLPALTETGAMRRLTAQAAENGLTVRGFYGEGTRAAWGYHQISNAVTRGLSGDEIAAAIVKVAEQIAALEERAGQELYRSDPAGLADRVWRAAGVLQNARRISTEEAMTRLAAVRLGVSLGILPGYDIKTIDRLSQEIWPGLLTRSKGPFTSQNERDEARAAVLREELNEQ
jgi:protein arginine kinase